MVERGRALAGQRQLLDRLLLVSQLPMRRYLALRQQLFDVPSICCVYHSGQAAVVYGPDDVPLCGPCGLAVYQALAAE